MALAAAARRYDALAVSKPLRIALVVLGLAGALYGVASLTGGWLGEPPWWFHTEQNHWWLEQVPNPGATAVSAMVVVAGLGLALHALWPYRATRPFRFALGSLGAATVVYGISTLTGEWLGRPTWWWEPVFAGRFDGNLYDVIERPTHDLISGIVTVLGLALATIAAWPRRPARPSAG